MKWTFSSPRRADNGLRTFYFILVFCLPVILSGEEARIWVDATINGQRVRLAFDTGASDSVLFRSTAERLKLKLIDPPPDFRPAPGQVSGPVTEPVDFAYGTLTGRFQFGVFTVPSFAETTMEGVLSWHPLRDKVFMFDAARQKLNISDVLPEEATNWLKFKLRTEGKILGFEVGGEDSKRNCVYVDTGAEDGVALAPSFWRKWEATWTNQPATVSAFATPTSGLLVKNEFWAREISIGSLVLRNVPVREVDAREAWASIPDHAATLGLFALRRMDFVMDGTQGVVYARPRGDSAPAYPHNRLGAVFVPRDLESDPLLAHVAPGSPAYLAGVRDGDVLLKIDDLDVTKWRTDPRVMPTSRFWTLPPGTILELTLKRGEREYQTLVPLKDILK